MPRGRFQRIQDPVHGLMEFEGMETVVVDALRTPEIQRLRKIKQTGLVHFVFPGAEHSRFSHSLGTSYLAITFGRHLLETTSEFLLPELRPDTGTVCEFALAALCHDLGHGPLSHVWEREVVDEFDLQKWTNALGISEHQAALRNAKWHEVVTQGLLAWPEGKLHRVLENHDKGLTTRIRLMLQNDCFLTYLPNLLSGDIDIDRMDYIKRDAMLCGAGYTYDLPWLRSTCAVGETETHRLVTGFDDRKATWVVGDFLRARHSLYGAVYQHRTVRSAEGMVSLFLRRLKKLLQDDPSLSVPALAKPLVQMLTGQAIGPSEILGADDNAIWVLIQELSNRQPFDETIRDLGGRILERNLFKMVPVEPSAVDRFFRKDDAHQQIYDVVRRYCLGIPEYYVVKDHVDHSVFSGAAREQSYLISADATAVPIRTHAAFSDIDRRSSTFVRLFTVREAVDDLRSLISKQ